MAVLELEQRLQIRESPLPTAEVAKQFGVSVRTVTRIRGNTTGRVCGSIEERFWAKVSQSSGCWLWTACINKDGYGIFSIDTKAVLAHRLSYEWANQPILAGMNICHKCDEPRCVRPDHLYMGTQAENVDDMVARGRLGSRKGVNNPRAKLSLEKARRIRQLHQEGWTYSSLMHLYGVSYPTLRSVIAERRWKG